MLKKFFKSAPGLRLLTGALLGLTLPLGKMVLERGIEPTVWVFVISVGVGSVLLIEVL
jgi:hypothetical protein